jgi:hypothetical protein
MHIDPVYQSGTSLDGVPIEVTHLKHAVVGSSAEPFGQQNNTQRGLNDLEKLAIRDRLRHWEQEEVFIKDRCLPNEEEDLGQEGEVANMQTRPRVSNPLIDGMSNSVGDGFTAPSLSGEDLPFEFDPAQTILNCGDLVELSYAPH